MTKRGHLTKEEYAECAWDCYFYAKHTAEGLWPEWDEVINSAESAKIYFRLAGKSYMVKDCDKIIDLAPDF